MDVIHIKVYLKCKFNQNTVLVRFQQWYSLKTSFLAKQFSTNRFRSTRQLTAITVFRSDVHTLRLDISNYDTELDRIEAGDHVAIFPMNSQELVQNLIAKLPYAPDPSRVFTLQNTSNAI